MELGKRFLDLRDIEIALADIGYLAKQNVIDVALIGGVAMSLLGSDRMTADIDVIASDMLPTIKVLKRLSFGGFAGTTEKGHPVDVVIRDDEYAPLYVEALEQAQDVGLLVKVVKPEYLAAMKMAAGRKRDELDLCFLISKDLDVSATSEIVKKFLGLYAVKEFEALVAEVKWRKSRGEDADS